MTDIEQTDKRSKSSQRNKSRQTGRDGIGVADWHEWKQT